MISSHSFHDMSILFISIPACTPLFSFLSFLVSSVFAYYGGSSVSLTLLSGVLLAQVVVR